jgi:integrase
MVDGGKRSITARNIEELQERVNKVADLPVTKNKIKVSEWIEKWLNNVEALKKDATYAQYKGIYNEHIKPEIGNKLLKNIKQDDIQNVITQMSKKTSFTRRKNKETGKMEIVDTGKKLSACTMKHARKIMHIAFEKAFDKPNRLIPENPVYKIEIPNRQAKPRKTLVTKELKTLFEYAKKTRWYWAMRFLLVTGLRRGELLALRWSDIDRTNRRIIIDESNSESGVGDTKSSKVHYVPLSELALFYLDMQKEMLQKETNPCLYNEDLKKLDLIFPSKTGQLLKPDSFNSAIDRINVKAGIHVTPHMFRHTFVYMSKGKLSRSELQEALGHDESTTTEDIYGTMLTDTQKVAKKIDSAFNELETEMDKLENESMAKVVNMFEMKRKIESGKRSQSGDKNKPNDKNKPIF